MPKKGAKIEDVAAATDVSIMTVSRALRGVEGVSVAKRAEILRAAKRLGYSPNRNAMSLAAAHSTLIGISLPTLFNEVFADILEGMRLTFETAGFDTVIDTSDYSNAREQKWVDRMLDWKPAAVVLSGTQHSAEVRERLRGTRIPTLEIWDQNDDPIDICVGMDHAAAGRMIGDYVVAMGYRRPAFVGLKAGHDPRAEKRLAGLREALSRAGIAPIRIVREQQQASFEAGRQGTLALINGPAPMPDVICYLNDHMAFGGLTTCESRGLHAPDAIGIIGFNGLSINAVLPRPITTVVTPRRLIGLMGARLLLARIHGAAVERRTVFPAELQPGRTTRLQGATSV